LATTLFQSSPSFHLKGQQSFGPINVALTNAFAEVVLTVNMSQADLADPTLSFTAAFQLSTDGGLTWRTTDEMDYQGPQSPNGKTGIVQSPFIGFDSNTLAMYEGNQMQIVTNTPNQITCQVTVVGQ
jgi:hypothetical protein